MVVGQSVGVSSGKGVGYHWLESLRGSYEPVLIGYHWYMQLPNKCNQEATIRLERCPSRCTSSRVSSGPEVLVLLGSSLTALLTQKKLVPLADNSQTNQTQITLWSAEKPIGNTNFWAIHTMESI